MKLSPRTIAGGLAIIFFSAVLSGVMTFLMVGGGICGSGNIPQLAIPALIFAFLIPFAAGMYLRVWWRLGALSFSWAFLWLLLVLIQAGWKSNVHDLAIVGICIGLSCFSAWLGQRIVLQQKETPAA